MTTQLEMQIKIQLEKLLLFIITELNHDWLHVSKDADKDTIRKTPLIYHYRIKPWLVTRIETSFRYIQKSNVICI